MNPRKRVAIAFLLGFSIVGGIVWRLSRISPPQGQPARLVNLEAQSADNAAPATSTPHPDLSPASQTAAPATPTATATPSSTTTPSPSPVATATVPDQTLDSLRLIIPVQGVRREQLIDTFSDARSEGRVHDAIDIPAPANTPVLAAADGKIVKLFHSDRGGTTIYQSSSDGKFIYYYAHLARYADGIVEGMQIRQGDIIAYVGDTGNAGAGNYHLHFSIARVADPKRYWDGTNINPYPILRR